MSVTGTMTSPPVIVVPAPAAAPNPASPASLPIGVLVEARVSVGELDLDAASIEILAIYVLDGVLGVLFVVNLHKPVWSL